MFTKAKEIEEISEPPNNHQWTRKKSTGEPASEYGDETDDSKSKMSSSHHSLAPSSDQSFGKKTPQYNSFRLMKQKVCQNLSLYTHLNYLKFIKS